MRFATISASLVALTLAAACSTNPAPASGSRPNPNGRMRGQSDTMPGNTVIENARPDLPARAGMLVVANQDGASATVVNAATLQTIATVPVGVGPHEVAVSHDGRWAVVTNYGDGTTPGHTLSVIDLAAAMPAVTRTIDLGEYHRPHGVAFAGDGNTLVVTSETSQRLVLVDFISGKVDTALATNARGSHMVAVRRDGQRAWTANIQDGSVTEYDLRARRTGRSFPGAPMNEGIAITPGGAQIWVGSNFAHTVTVLDGARAMPVDTLEGFGAPYRLGISRSGTVALVNDPLRNRIWMYEAGSRKRIAELDLSKAEGIKVPAAVPTGGAPGESGAGPEGVTFDPIADFAYVTLHGTNQVVAVDLRRRKVAGFGPVGAGPDGVAFSPLVANR